MSPAYEWTSEDCPTLVHLAKITNHDTGDVETFCGITRRPYDAKGHEDVCTRCILGAISSNARHFDQEIERLARAVDVDAKDDRRKWIGWYDSVTLRLELMEDRLAKAERKAKRAKR